MQLGEEARDWKREEDSSLSKVDQSLGTAGSIRPEHIRTGCI